MDAVPLASYFGTSFIIEYLLVSNKSTASLFLFDRARQGRLNSLLEAESSAKNQLSGLLFCFRTTVKWILRVKK